MMQRIPPLYATEKVELADKQRHAQYFVGACDWYVAEQDPVTGDGFGYVDLGHGEWGYFNLVEMERTVVSGWLVVERDLDFRTTTTTAVAAGIG